MRMLSGLKFNIQDQDNKGSKMTEGIDGGFVSVISTSDESMVLQSNSLLNEEPDDIRQQALDTLVNEEEEDKDLIDTEAM